MVALLPFSASIADGTSASAATTRPARTLDSLDWLDGSGNIAVRFVRA